MGLLDDNNNATNKATKFGWRRTIRCNRLTNHILAGDFSSKTRSSSACRRVGAGHHMETLAKKVQTQCIAIMRTKRALDPKKKNAHETVVFFGYELMGFLLGLRARGCLIKGRYEQPTLFPCGNKLPTINHPSTQKRAQRSRQPGGLLCIQKAQYRVRMVGGCQSEL